MPVSAAYVGCFKNENGAQRLNSYIIDDKSFAGCQQAARLVGTPFFGLENPGGAGVVLNVGNNDTVPGNAECILLDALPQQSKAADSECAVAKGDHLGDNRLGGAYRLAVYKQAAGTAARPPRPFCAVPGAVHLRTAGPCPVCLCPALLLCAKARSSQTPMLRVHARPSVCLHHCRVISSPPTRKAHTLQVVFGRLCLAASTSCANRQTSSLHLRVATACGNPG